MEPYATREQYEARYGRFDDPDALAACLAEATQIVDSALVEAGMSVDWGDAELPGKLATVCLRMANRSLEQADASIPFGATQVNMTGGSYSRGFSFGGNPYGDVYLSSSDMRLLGIGAGRSAVVSPYGGAPC